MLERGFAFKRKSEESVIPLKPELFAHMRAMILDRSKTDIELQGDLFAGLVLCYQLEDPMLGGTEFLEDGFLPLTERRNRRTVNSPGILRD